MVHLLVDVSPSLFFCVSEGLHSKAVIIVEFYPLLLADLLITDLGDIWFLRV